MMRMLLGLIAGVTLAAVSVAGAEWSAPPVAQWGEALSLQGSDTEKPPHGSWADEGGAVVAQGLTRFWTQRLLPGDQGPAQEISVKFTVEESARKGRQLPGGCVRWGFHWGENLPGWDVGVIVRWSDALNFYRVQLSADRGELALWDSTGAFLQLIPCKVEVGAPHNLTVKADGAHFTASLDGVAVMDYWDRSLPHENGQVGLAAWQSRVRFEDFAVTKLEPSGETVPPHVPDLRIETTEGLMLGHPAFGQEPSDGVIIFDGNEPISRYWRQGNDPKYKGSREAMFHEAVKLRPGWRPEYYTWVGPKVYLRVLPLTGELPSALNITEQGEKLVFDFVLEEPGMARAEEVCTVDWDAEREVYRYLYDAKVTFTWEEPSDYHYYELADPLTYNNREPGPEVTHQWNASEHEWNVYEAKAGGWARYPLIDYLGGYNNLATKWGEVTSFLYPDPLVCPTWKITMGWDDPDALDREFRIGLCHWGYDFHHKEEGARIKLDPGTERNYTLVMTGIPMDEAAKIYAQSAPAPEVLTSTDRYATFRPDGTTFDELSERPDPTHTMVWEQGIPDAEVGREDSHSLRIDGPGNASVQVYQYAIEQYADKWWLRGWVKSEGVKGRGLQARVKYSYGAEPEDVFYMGARGDNGWTRFSFLTEAPKRRDSTTITFELDGTGQVWLDDVAFGAVGVEEAPRVTVVPVPAGMEASEDLLIDLPMSEEPLKAVYDESRNGHALFLAGPQWMAEDGNGFLRFDGLDDDGTIPIKPILEPTLGAPDDNNQRTIFPMQAFSYEFWVRPGDMPEAITRSYIFHYRNQPRLWVDKGGAAEGELRLVYDAHPHRGVDACGGDPCGRRCSVLHQWREA